MTKDELKEINEFIKNCTDLLREIREVSDMLPDGFKSKIIEMIKNSPATKKGSSLNNNSW